jgi:opacity protein-like surface antigen
MIKFTTAALAVAALTASSAYAAEATQPVQAANEAVAANAAVSVTAGKMLYSTAGTRIAAIYRVTSNGDAQLILNGRLVTVPASSLSEVNGKVATSLTKAELTKR